MDKTEKLLKVSKEQNIPIFVLSAKAPLSNKALSFYHNKCALQRCSTEHLKGIEEKLISFTLFNDDSNKIKVPIFIFIAKDHVAFLCLDYYLEKLIAENIHESYIEELENKIKEFEEWRSDNLNLVSLPD